MTKQRTVIPVQNASEPENYAGQLQPFIRYALKTGWKVSGQEKGPLRFVKPGLPAIYTLSLANRERG